MSPWWTGDSCRVNPDVHLSTAGSTTTSTNTTHNQSKQAKMNEWMCQNNSEKMIKGILTHQTLDFAFPQRRNPRQTFWQNLDCECYRWPLSCQTSNTDMAEIFYVMFVCDEPWHMWFLLLHILHRNTFHIHTHKVFHCELCLILFLQKSLTPVLLLDYSHYFILHKQGPTPSTSLPLGPHQLLSSLTITPLIPPVDCQPCLSGLAWQSHVMSYWSWRSLNIASIPRPYVFSAQHTRA